MATIHQTDSEGVEVTVERSSMFRDLTCARCHANDGDVYRVDHRVAILCQPCAKRIATGVKLFLLESEDKPIEGDPPVVYPMH